MRGGEGVGEKRERGAEREGREGQERRESMKCRGGGVKRE